MSFYPHFPENQDKHFPLFDLYALRERFHSLFPHGWDFIVKETPDSPWKTVKKYKLTEQKVWYKYTDSEIILGVRFGSVTCYGLFDLDWGSIYDPRRQEDYLKRLQHSLEDYGIVRYAIVQSSLSRGLHLYFFFDRPVNTFRLACVMNKAAVEAGLEVKRGQLETFPNTKAYNKLFHGHRLPLQQGSYLLDSDYIPESDRLEDFLHAAEWSAAGNDTELLESRLEVAYDWFKATKNQERLYHPTPEDKEFIEQVEYAQREIKEGFLNKIRLRIEQGLSAFHQTNELLLTIGKLGRLYYGLVGNKLINYIRETIVSCPGYAEYCRHKHEILRRCKEVARYAEKHWFPYRTRLPQDRTTYKRLKESLTNQTNINIERQYNARCRIVQAIERIIKVQGALPQKVGECKLAIRNVTKELFGMSVSDATLKKTENLILWHPKYRQEPTPVQEQPEEDREEEAAASAEPIPVEDTAESSTVNEVEVKRVTYDVNDVPQKAPTDPIVQPPLQSESSLGETHSHQAAPHDVVREKEEQSNTLNPLPGLRFQKMGYTLPLMKGVMLYLVSNFIYRVLQREYYNALMSTPGLELLYLGFQGNSTQGLVQRKGENKSSIQLIIPKTEVEVLREDYHSSWFQEKPRQMLVYVRPLKNAQYWLNGIAVLIEHVIPIRIRDKISKSNKTSKTNKIKPKQ
ncbi:MAG: hypothetical protein QNJ34_12725 [Xenococcaceae cyanobacterium MO_188.B29]|nr:hypothetical protein [Xenococcaceae cyanobacterium MO_188.B29]